MLTAELSELYRKTRQILKTNPDNNLEKNIFSVLPLAENLKSNGSFDGSSREGFPDERIEYISDLFMDSKRDIFDIVGFNEQGEWEITCRLSDGKDMRGIFKDYREVPFLACGDGRKTLIELRQEGMSWEKLEDLQACYHHPPKTIFDIDSTGIWDRNPDINQFYESELS
ncbi:MAG: hypothetical protein PHH54_00200 [Candidatus Nanoarchaeia archaeon]|nr:hypothetical protein [Candidatus Nanoarchaeia archaeon]MDD5740383.1 hypothetical protein [Candidatus Nanoarchaeia archaeon]